MSKLYILYILWKIVVNLWMFLTNNMTGCTFTLCMLLCPILTMSFLETVCSIYRVKVTERGSATKIKRQFHTFSKISYLRNSKIIMLCYPCSGKMNEPINLINLWAALFNKRDCKRAATVSKVGLGPDGLRTLADCPLVCIWPLVNVNQTSKTAWPHQDVCCVEAKGTQWILVL